jgi:integrase
MSALAPALQAFFTHRLIIQRDSSPRTIAAYRDTFTLLLRFAHDQTGKQPFELDIDDLDAPLIGAFLIHLERDRGNSARTRNARLGAIHSFYRFAALEHPEHAHTIARVMAIPTKRHERSTVCYLDLTEITALLAAPDRGTLLGRRDRALLALMIQTGVRVSELVGLRVRDVHLGTGHHIRVLGRVSCAARCPPGGSFGAQLPSEPRGRFRCTWLSGDLCRGSGCCPWWMTSWQGWQTTRVLRRFLAMSAAQAGWPGPGVPRLASLRTWCTITVPGLPHSSHRRVRRRRTSSLRG